MLRQFTTSISAKAIFGDTSQQFPKCQGKFFLHFEGNLLNPKGINVLKKNSNPALTGLLLQLFIRFAPATTCFLQFSIFNLTVPLTADSRFNITSECSLSKGKSTGDLESPADYRVLLA